MNTEMLVVPAMMLVTSIGTTAPFSAMSGARMTMSLLSSAFAMPSAFMASMADFASNAPLFQAARATPGLNRAAPARANSPSAPPALMTDLRVCCMSPPPARLDV
jgi:hypothetical protein